MTASKYEQYLNSQSMSEIQELSPEQIHLHFTGKICLRGKRNSNPLPVWVCLAILGIVASHKILTSN